MAIASVTATGAKEFTWRDDERALFMPLLGGPKSSQAHAFVDALFDEIVPAQMFGQQLRPSSLKKARTALGALLGDLCRYRAQGRDGKHGVAPKDFTSAELGFGRPAFMRVKEALTVAGLMRIKNGWNFTREGFDGEVVRQGGAVTIFRLAPALIARLGDLCGPDAREHWSHGRPKVRPDEPLLVLRSSRRRDGTVEDLHYTMNEPGVADLVEHLEKLNAFLPDHVEGIAFAGLKRIYNDGNITGKRWRRGGRYYSRQGGERYEGMGEMARVKTIQLDGEVVDEVDIRASHLATFHGVLGLRFEPGHKDPYACGNIDREAVKTFLTASFGRGNLKLNRWSPRSKEIYAEKRPGHKLQDDYSVEDVRFAVLQRYPCLDRLEELGMNSLDLQWHEAEVLSLAMETLMDDNIPSLPVHDALLVADSKVEATRDALHQAFAIHFSSDKIVPALDVTYGGPYAEALNI